MDTQLFSFISSHFVSILIFLVFVSVIIGIFYHYLSLYKKYEENAYRSEKDFETSVLSQFNKVNINPKADNIINAQQFKSEIPENQIFVPNSQPQPVQQSPESDYLLSMRKSMDNVISKLYAANIVKNVEGPLPNNLGGMQNMLVHLKSGKTIFIIPCFESETYIINSLLRYDWILMILKNGEAVLVEKLSNFIADNVS